MVSGFSGAAYDSWLLKQADEYMESSCDGEPQVVDSYQEYEGKDSEGNVETSTVYVYSCEDCDNDECDHWREFHETDDGGEDE